MPANLAQLGATGRADLAPITPIDTYKPLDKYSGGLSDEQPRVPWLATISAGFKNDKGYPQASRKTDKNWIHMTAEDAERAPGLYAAVEANGFRWLDIALPFDDPNLFLQQRFSKRSATRLEAYGDEDRLIEIVVRKVRQGDRQVDVAERQVHPAGSIEYARLVRECSVSVSLFFALAEWNGRQPQLYFPDTDGLGVYRLRFTSRNSLREILASLRQISALTGGRLAGIPLRLSLDWREVADPTGARRTIGVWRLRFMPPEGLKLTPGVWQDLASKGLAEGQLLRLPAPTAESIDDAIEAVEANLDEPDADAVQALEDGPPCDARFYEQAWFARVKGSRLDSDQARAGFIEGFTGRRTDSLAEFLAGATEEQAAALIAAAGHYIGSERTAQRARTYDQIFGTEDDWDHAAEPPRARTVDAATGEVLTERAEDSAAGVAPTTAAAPEGRTEAPVVASGRRPSRTELWQRNRELSVQAQALGVSGVPVLINTSTADVIADANRVLEARIADIKLDQHLAAEQQQAAF